MSKDLELTKNLQATLDSTQQQNANLSQLQKLIFDLQKEIVSCRENALQNIDAQKQKLSHLSTDLKQIADSVSINTKDIEAIPGVRTPKWYDVYIDFDYLDASLKFNSVQINPEGPFVITQITPIWEYGPLPSTVVAQPGSITIGRTVPCSAFPMIVNNFGITNTIGHGNNTPSYAQLFNTYRSASGGVDGVLAAIPEFDFQIEIAGSGRFFTNQPIPAPAFYGYFETPNFLGVQGWAERGDKIVIHATPTVPVPTQGRVHFVLHGYQILGNVNISESLSYPSV